MNEVNFNGMFGQQGWICPKCGRVYSPFTKMCLNFLQCYMYALDSKIKELQKEFDEL